MTKARKPQSRGKVNPSAGAAAGGNGQTDETHSREAHSGEAHGASAPEEEASPHPGRADKRQPLVAAGRVPNQWLTLKDASELLGVHFTTLRAWADRGEIPVFRTPGGHRRFSVADLRRFLEERAGKPVVSDSDAFVSELVGRVRAEIERAPQEHAHWQYPLDESARAVRSRRGRELFGLAISFVLKPQQRDRILEAGRALGVEYGREAAESQVSLRDTGRAVQFFRHQLLHLLRSGRQGEGLDPEDVRVQHLLDQFVDEVLYAVLSGFEDSLSS